ncbi:hypothetical protein Adi01nite_77780 [Amorphoplanes digitatis]|nr:hypothetical protein Adi01nite_77780 [Actinoplanes digitatis]
MARARTRVRARIRAPATRGTTGEQVCNGSAGSADNSTDWTFQARAEARARIVLSARTTPVRPRRTWWRGLTDTGAASGVPTGGGAMAAVLVTVFGPTLSGWQTELLAQPAVWTVPLAFTVMVAGSLLTRGRVPADVGATMLAAAHPGSSVKETLRNACSAS